MKYQRTLQDHEGLRARINLIVQTGCDCLDYPSGSAIFDGMLSDLVAGVSLKEAHMRHGELIPPIQRAMDELFMARDQGVFMVEGGS